MTVDSLHTTVRGALVRNERGRLRIGHLDVVLEPAINPGDHERISRCLEVFEDYCTVTASIRPAIPVEVRVLPVSAPARVA